MISHLKARSSSSGQSFKISRRLAAAKKRKKKSEGEMSAEFARLELCRSPSSRSTRSTRYLGPNHIRRASVSMWIPAGLALGNLVKTHGLEKVVKMEVCRTAEVTSPFKSRRIKVATPLDLMCMLLKLNGVTIHKEKVNTD